MNVAQNVIKWLGKNLYNLLCIRNYYKKINVESHFYRILKVFKK